MLERNLQFCLVKNVLNGVGLILHINFQQKKTSLKIALTFIFCYAPEFNIMFDALILCNLDQRKSSIYKGLVYFIKNPSLFQYFHKNVPILIFIILKIFTLISQHLSLTPWCVPSLLSWYK